MDDETFKRTLIERAARELPDETADGILVAAEHADFWSAVFIVSAAMIGIDATRKQVGGGR